MLTKQDNGQAVPCLTITNNSTMNKTVQSIVSLTAFSALLIVITLFCGGLGFGRLFRIYGIMEYCFLGLLIRCNCNLQGL